MSTSHDFSKLIETLHVGVVVQLPSTEIVMSNAMARELLGLTEDQLLGKTSLDPDWNVIHEDGTPFPGSTHPSSCAIATGQSVVDVVMGVFRPTSNDRVWLFVSAHPRLNPENSVQDVVVTFTDITARKNAERERIRVAERLKFAINISNIGFWDWDILENKVVYSPEWKAQLGFNVDEIHSDLNEWKSRIHPNDIEKTLARLHAHLEGTEREYDVEFRMRHKDGSWRWINARGDSIRDRSGKPISMLGSHLDITERKQMEDELQAHKSRLELLSKQLINTHETTLSHVARELHDEFGQVLTAMRMNLRGLQKTADESLRIRIESNISLIDRAVQQVRHISVGLRPFQLDDLGLAAALHWLIKEQAKVAGFQESLTVDPPDLCVAPELAVVCFRIAQEAVTNAVKHAAASRIEIRLRQEGGVLHLTIWDDGSGFNVNHASTPRSSPSGLGLLNMRERALLANGKCDIESQVGHGTTVHATFPPTKQIRLN